MYILHTYVYLNTINYCMYIFIYIVCLFGCMHMICIIHHIYLQLQYIYILYIVHPTLNTTSKNRPNPRPQTPVFRVFIFVAAALHQRVCRFSAAVPKLDPQEKLQRLPNLAVKKPPNRRFTPRCSQVSVHMHRWQALWQVEII